MQLKHKHATLQGACTPRTTCSQGALLGAPVMLACVASPEALCNQQLSAEMVTNTFRRGRTPPAGQPAPACCKIRHSRPPQCGASRSLLQEAPAAYAPAALPAACWVQPSSCCPCCTNPHGAPARRCPWVHVQPKQPRPWPNTHKCTCNTHIHTRTPQAYPLLVSSAAVPGPTRARTGHACCVIAIAGPAMTGRGCRVAALQVAGQLLHTNCITAPSTHQPSLLPVLTKKHP
jgi:hypothetical protein